MLSIVIFLSIFSTRIYTEETFDCTGYEDDSFHPMSNAQDCRFYWHCIFVNTIYMKAVKRVCPAGMEFDVRLNGCEWTGLINCVSMISPEVSPIETTTTPPQIQVLPNNSSQLLSTFSIEQLLNKLAALKLVSTTTTTSPSLFTSKLKRRHLIHRDNLTLNILISTERKIRQFPLHQTHGLLIHCNQLRRRQLRNLIFRTPKATTIPSHSSAKILQSNIFSLTIVLSFLQR